MGGDRERDDGQSKKVHGQQVNPSVLKKGKKEQARTGDKKRVSTKVVGGERLGLADRLKQQQTQSGTTGMRGTEQQTQSGSTAGATGGEADATSVKPRHGDERARLEAREQLRLTAGGDRSNRGMS